MHYNDLEVKLHLETNTGLDMADQQTLLSTQMYQMSLLTLS